MAFEAPHVGFHIFPIGAAVGRGGESDYLLCQTLCVAFITEVVFATDAVGNGGNVGACVFVQMWVVANGYVGRCDKVFCLIDGIAHRTLAVADESDAVATLHHRGNRLDEIENAVVEIGGTEITNTLLVAMQVVQAFGFAWFKNRE